MAECVIYAGQLDGVLHLELQGAGVQNPGIPDLATGFGVERCAVEQHVADRSTADRRQGGQHERPQPVEAMPRRVPDQARALNRHCGA